MVKMIFLQIGWCGRKTIFTINEDRRAQSRDNTIYAQGCLKNEKTRKTIFSLSRYTPAFEVLLGTTTRPLTLSKNLPIQTFR
jgi:hypothetical protein